MRLIFDQSLAAGFISINTRQMRVSLPFKPCVLERNIYNNDVCGEGCNTLSQEGLANVNTFKKMFYPQVGQIELKFWSVWGILGVSRIAEIIGCHEIL